MHISMRHGAVCYTVTGSCVSRNWSNREKESAVIETITNQITLEWVDGLRFEGRAGNAVVAIDGDGRQGTSPVNLLLEAIGSCAAADVVDILEKGRQAVKSMTVEVSADRREGHPRSLKRMEIRFKIRGQVDESKARRAVDLSLEKYCSVFHSLRMDISLDTHVVVKP